MQLVQDEKKSNSTVIVDGKHFVNCEYIDCTLYYSGDDYEITSSDFKNCKVTLGGPAQRAVKFVQQFGVKFDQPQEIKKGKK